MSVHWTFVNRRSFLAVVGSTFLAPSNSALMAAGLVADDGSPVRLVDVTHDRMRLALQYGQRFGADGADVILTELSDYNCGFCRRAWSPLSQIQQHN